MQAMDADQKTALTQKYPSSPTVIVRPTIPKIPTPPDTSVQNLEESFNDYATVRSTPTERSNVTDATSVQKIEKSVQANITNADIDMQINSSIAASGQQYIGGRIQTSVMAHIKSEDIQDQIRDVTNQHINLFLDIEGSLKEEHMELSAQVINLKEQMSEGYCLLAELKNTNEDLQAQNLRLQVQNDFILQDTIKAIDQASTKQIHTVQEQLELLTTRGLAKAERSAQSKLRKTTKSVADTCKQKIPDKLASYDKIISDKYDEHIEKGTDLLYEMGNTTRTDRFQNLSPVR